MAEEAEALGVLSEIMSAIQEDPYDLSLHAKHIQEAQKYGLPEQANDARRLMTNFWAAADDVWLPLIDHRLQQDRNTVEDALEIHDLFNRAEDDYLCMLNPCASSLC